MIAEQDTSPRRILVGLDVSEQSLAALESAARLAAVLEAELVGLFVEDSELLQMASLPIARLVGARSTSTLDPAVLRRAFKVQAAEARQALEKVAEERKLKWSFRISQGHAAETLVSEARQFDLVALGWTSRPAVRTSRLGSTARLATRTATCSVFLSRSGKRPGCPLVVLYEGSDRILPLAAALGRVFVCPIIVKVLAEDEDTASRLKADAENWLREHGVEATVTTMRGDNAAEDIREAVETADSNLLLMDQRGPVAAGLDLASLIDELRTPALLLR